MVNVPVYVRLKPLRIGGQRRQQNVVMSDFCPRGRALGRTSAARNQHDQRFSPVLDKPWAGLPVANFATTA